MKHKKPTLRIDTHRGYEGTDFGKHTRIPLKLNKLDAKSLLILSYIDIDQFLDYDYQRGKKRRVITLDTFELVLGLGKAAIRRCIKELEDDGYITPEFKRNIGTSYISNIYKEPTRYQIFTYSFITRPDLSYAVKAFIIKVIMLGDKRIFNIRHIAALVKETGVARKQINAIIAELLEMSYIIPHEYEPLIQVLDVKSIMLDSEDRLIKENIALKKKVAALQDFSAFESTIAELKKQIEVLTAKLHRLQNKNKNE
jgi:hypothetical protein